jgi:nucleosome binding factor SPN SPT16 subunit
MASRTLIVNAKDEQKAAYQIALEAIDLLNKSLKVGEKLSNVYTSVKKFITDKNSNLVLHSNFGFGIGFNFKEEALTISASN